MFSGKTEELIRRIRRTEYARQIVLPIKHKIDQRSGNIHKMTSHSGQKLNAFSIDGQSMSVEKILSLKKNISVVAIDEVQFFPYKIISIILALVEKNIRVIVAGLDLDFRGEPFGIMPILLALADEIIKLKAICVRCSQEAHHSQRVVNDKPARYEDPIILVGAEEYYEARCRRCFSIDKKTVSTEKQKETSSIKSLENAS
jgi:thymidine kinase